MSEVVAHGARDAVEIWRRVESEPPAGKGGGRRMLISLTVDQAVELQKSLAAAVARALRARAKAASR